MSEIPQEVIDRMVALVRTVAEQGRAYVSITEACAIVALLPEPVDPDLIEARRMAAEAHQDHNSSIRIRAGDCDNWNMVEYRLEGIKRGRELAAQS